MWIRGRGAPGKWETYTLNVPTETEVPTTQVRLLIPRDFEIEMIGHSPLWQIRSHAMSVGIFGRSPGVAVASHHRRLPNSNCSCAIRLPPGLLSGKSSNFIRTAVSPPGKRRRRSSPQASVGGAQRAEEAWRAAQVATTVSLVALGIAVMLILVTAIGIVQSGRGRKGKNEQQ